jgi:hypothetical protein
MAGGGVKPGIVYGETDELDYNIATDGLHIHDFHATLLHLLGVDHERLTYKFQGRRYRLTDVHGHVVKGHSQLKIIGFSGFMRRRAGGEDRLLNLHINETIDEQTLATKQTVLRDRFQRIPYGNSIGRTMSSRRDSGITTNSLNSASNMTPSPSSSKASMPS